MEPPKVASRIHDPQLGITFTVMAYRPLTRDELIEQVSIALRDKPFRKQCDKGNPPIIVTTLGASG